jgi:hypothetical protein
LETSYPILQKLRNASRLSPRGWLFFIEAWFWLLIFDIGLRTLSFSKIQVYAANLALYPAPFSKQIDELILALSNAVDHARYNHLYPMTCLRRSLTLQKMLSERGISTELKIGVHKEAKQLIAHAWVEYQGKPIGEREYIAEKFSPLQKTTLEQTGKSVSTL